MQNLARIARDVAYGELPDAKIKERWAQVWKQGRSKQRIALWCCVMELRGLALWRKQPWESL